MDSKLLTLLARILAKWKKRPQILLLKSRPSGIPLITNISVPPGFVSLKAPGICYHPLLEHIGCLTRRSIFLETPWYIRRVGCDPWENTSLQNEQCVTQSDQTMRGTCFSQANCQQRGGIADGNCASGFGICCMFSIRTCGGTVVQNCTYIQNMGFPATTTNISQTCNFIFNRIDPDICQVRLDFDTTVLRTDPNLPGMCGGAGDSLQVGSPLSGLRFAFPPTVCGTLSGQHMYIESSRMGSNAGTLTIQTGTTPGERRYKIKVTYVDCQSRLRAPSGCAQFFTGASGTITSYNFQGNQLLRNQDYSNCIRQEEGFCQFELFETPGVANAFSVSTNANNLAQVGQCKNRNFVTVPSMVLQPGGSPAFSDYRCGQTFSGQSGDTTPGSILSTRSTPFQIQVHTLKADLAPGVIFGGLKGFSLNYNQIPC